MKIFKLILIFFILISPANSNNIYNLIKIPNLEVYELKSPNNLKYFYAKKPFMLGVQKNIDVKFDPINNANHFYKGKEKELSNSINSYIKEKITII